jgi:hypothetical protein
MSVRGFVELGMESYRNKCVLCTGSHEEDGVHKEVASLLTPMT